MLSASYVMWPVKCIFVMTCNFHSFVSLQRRFWLSLNRDVFVKIVVLSTCSCQGSNQLFCSYPFLFDGQAKTLLLQVDAMVQMQVVCCFFVCGSVSNDDLSIRNFDPLAVPLCTLLLLHITDTRNAYVIFYRYGRCKIDPIVYEII